MDGRERLRAYLEQRRELGESEFVLDGMSVEEALGAIDKLRVAQRSQPRPPSPKPPLPKPPASTGPRAEPRAERPTPVVSAPPALPVESSRGSEPVPDVHAEASHAEASPNVAEPDADYGDMTKFKQGVVVGNQNGTLFEQNPFHSVRSLKSLAALIEDCTRCKLYKTARNAVPGEGDPNADLMCVGEAPGANEDETGRPFVGQAGALLTKILAAIDLTREQVFIANVLKHRPPGNRNPQPDEVEACSPYLVRQIQMVKPKVILALGTFAAQTLLETKTPIGKLRGAVHRYYGIPLIVTYHPAALLRNPAWKRPTWEDVKLARHVLDASKS
jgi:uracil-DNA glycosylase